jgi:hypothetical protein
MLMMMGCNGDVMGMGCDEDVVGREGIGTGIGIGKKGIGIGREGVGIGR